jgi:hypothetical protein
VFDTVISVTVNEVEAWKVPSRFIDTAVRGVMLTSPVDMIRLWPELWPNEIAARRAVKDGVPTLPRFVPVTYQLAGDKMKRRGGWFDLNLIPDPEAWLVDHLGPLALYEGLRKEKDPGVYGFTGGPGRWQVKATPTYFVTRPWPPKG